MIYSVMIGTYTDAALSLYETGILAHNYFVKQAKTGKIPVFRTREDSD